MTISYDATTQSYTVTAGSNTMTFTQADKVNSGSTDFTAFNKANGSVNDSLSLTNPGTSGPLSYKYVGGGAWEHVTIGSNTLDFRYNPFSYGIATPDSALVRTGTGLYAVSLVGAMEGGKPLAMAGSGTMQVDFLNGALTADGALTSIDVNTGLIQSLGIFFGSATLSSTANSFSGAFAMEDGTRYTGSWQGRFYGPSAEEVGAVWSLSSAGGVYAAGYLLGRGDNTVTAYNRSLTSLQFTETFAHRFSETIFKDNGNNTTATNPTLFRTEASMTYDATAGSYRYVDTGRSIDTTFAAADLSSAKSTSAVAIYEMTGTNGINYRLSLSKPGSGNPQIALTYASFGHWEQAQAGTTNARDRWFVWGVRTNGFQIPTGSASYTGVIAGKAIAATGGASYTLGGTSSFDVNFSSANFTGSLKPTGVSSVDGSTRNFGTYKVASGLMNVDGVLTANVTDTADKYLGYFQGALFGPQANELGGTFGFQNIYLESWASPDSNTFIINGATLATKTTP